jgi:hypothetical protein
MFREATKTGAHPARSAPLTAFLGRIATYMLTFEGDSHAEWFEGNFAAYDKDKKRRLGIDRVTS